MIGFNKLKKTIYTDKFIVLNKGVAVRQFEPHSNGNIILAGTNDGETCLIDMQNSTHSYNISHLGKIMEHDKDKSQILALRWLTTESNTSKYLVGNSTGHIAFGNIDNLSVCNQYDHFETLKPLMFFKDLTSLHSDCLDSRLIVSGDSKNIKIFDIQTGAPCYTIENAHKEHINIVRYFNHNPNCFVSISSDMSCKTWDTRTNREIYTIEGNKKLIMVSISPNDDYFITTGKDNEINQYLTYGGEHLFKCELPKSNSRDSCIRACYSFDGKLIFSGSTDDPYLNINSSSNGDLISSKLLFPGRQDSSLYVQSLRSSHKDNSCYVLAKYKKYQSTADLVKIVFNRDSDNLLSENFDTSLYTIDNNSDCKLEKTSITNCVPTTIKKNMLELFYELNYQVVKSSTDHVQLFIGGNTYMVHRSIISARSPVLKFLLQKERETSSIFIDDIPEIITYDLLYYFIIYLYCDNIDIIGILNIVKRLPIEKENIENKSRLNIFDIQLCDIWSTINTVQQELLVDMLDSLMNIAIFFQVPSMCFVLDTILCTGIRNNTILKISNIAIKFSRSELLNYCKWYCCCNFKLIDTVKNKYFDISIFLQECFEISNKCNLPLVCPIYKSFDTGGIFTDRKFPIIPDATLQLENNDTLKDDWTRINFIVNHNNMNYNPVLIGTGYVLLSNGTILFIGGHNITSYYSLKCLLTFDVELNLWSTFKTFGNTPKHLYSPTTIPFNCNFTQFVIVLDGITSVKNGTVDLDDERFFQYVLNCNNGNWTKLSSNITLSTKKYINHVSFYESYNKSGSNLKYFILFGGQMLNNVMSDEIIIGKPEISDGELVYINYTVINSAEDSIPHRGGSSILEIPSGCNEIDQVIIFGGSDHMRAYNDLHLLKCKDRTTIICNPLISTGEPCPPLFLSSLHLVNNNTVAVLGGNVQNNIVPYEGVYFLNLNFSQEILTDVRWSFISNSVIYPGMTTTIQYQPNSFIQFGGISKSHPSKIPRGKILNIDLDFSDIITANVKDITTEKCLNFHKPPEPTLPLQSSDFLSDLLALSMDTSTTDFTIIKDGDVVKVHKFMLFKSEFLNTLVKSENFLENKTDQLEISDSEISLKTLHIILLFLYTGNLYCGIDELLDVFNVAIEWIIKDLTIACESMLINYMKNIGYSPDVDTVNQYIFILQIADRFSLKTLKTICFSYILRTIGKRELSEFIDDEDIILEFEKFRLENHMYI